MIGSKIRLDNDSWLDFDQVFDVLSYEPRHNSSAVVLELKDETGDITRRVVDRKQVVVL